VIKQEDPQAKVVTAPNVLYFDRDDLFAVIQSDVAPMFDVVSWHGIYSAAPDSEFYGNYYYEYPGIVEEIKQTANAHGFDGEFWAPEISWCSAEYPTCYSPDQPYKVLGSDKIAAKYDARSFILHLGMDVGIGWGGLESIDAPWTFPTIQRLNTIMAGTEPISHVVKIENELDIFIIPFSKETLTKAIEISVSLRKTGFIVDMDIKRRNMSKNLKFASNKNAKFVIFIGEDELKSGSALVRSMSTGEQEKVGFGELAEYFKKVI